MRSLLLGNEAIARGAFEAGVTVATAYPGTPSTEITEYIATYDAIYAEWSPNEKVALEVALGASVAGARAICAMKHVGLNVAADPLFTAAYTGVNGGLVICVADDPGMHSSQNEQDSRHYAFASKTLMLEPSDSEECLSYIKQAFTLSEDFDTPVLIRLTTRVSHSRGLAETAERVEQPPKPYVKDIRKYVMMPGNARGRHVVVEERINKLRAFTEKTELNRIERNGSKIGVITSGIAYQYAREALGDDASYLKLGVVYPLPERLIADFVQSVETCYVIEELEPIIEEHCLRLGLSVKGKSLFSLCGEYTTNAIRAVVKNEPTAAFTVEESIPARPPILCAGCPHRGVFYVLNQMKLTVSGDIGCYTLGALPPASAIDTTICMGASIGMAHGIEKAAAQSLLNRRIEAGSDENNGANTVAIIGDSTFIHSGITGLIDTVYNKGTSTVIILDNRITGMTGHQDHPGTGKTIKGEPTYAVQLEKLCEAVGVRRISVVDPFDIDNLRVILKRELEADEPSVIITRRPCRLLIKDRLSPYCIDTSACKNCGLCMKMGCPAILRTENGVAIDSAACAGCGCCARVCKSNAIHAHLEEPEVNA